MSNTVSEMIIHPEELSKEWIDKLADAGITTLGIHPRGGAMAAESLKELVTDLQTPEYRELIDYARARGLEVVYEMHSMGYLLPREYFVEHPEYFRVDASGARTDSMNFCVSNQDALDIVVRNAAELAPLLYGSSHSFYFWMDDGVDVHCHCPKCSRLSPSDQQMLVLNGMLREIKKNIPDAKLAYLAYVDSVVPPVQVSADEGIFLEYAPFEKYTAKGDEAQMRIEREKEMMTSLIKMFKNEPKRVLEYWYDNSLYSNWTKPPVKFELNEAQMVADIREYRECGFDEIATFACFLGSDYNELYGDVDITPFAENTK